jgi:hypothetical protein
MSALKLTSDQTDAYGKFASFIAHPTKKFMILSGYAGTGKTTLVTHLIDQLPQTLKIAQLINQDTKKWAVALTATTNKAAEALADITGEEVKTIASFLGLRVQTNYRTSATALVANARAVIQKDFIIFIDEASYVDDNLLSLIMEWTRDCKIIFIGDPAQLTTVTSNNVPVWEQSYTKAELTEVVRQAKGNPIIDLATSFRETVRTGEFFSFTPDGYHVRHMPRDQFDAAVINEFSRPDWTDQDSKVLAWTNKTIISYNKAIRELVEGTPELQAGDYAVCNKYICSGKRSIKTDERVMVNRITPSNELGLEGWTVSVKEDTFFLPKSNEDKKTLLKKFEAQEKFDRMEYIENNWIDLRASYACTINKAQGSTYDKVFIDLDDIKRCSDPNQIARMLYVAVSRARNNVYLTGDIV